MIRIMLSKLLGERKMTQKDLAIKAGIRPNTINALYHGYAKMVSLQNLDKICKALDCSLDELMEYKSDNPDH